MAATEQAVYFTTKKGKATVYLPDVKHYSTGDRYKATLERKGNTNVFLLKSVEKKAPEKTVEERITIERGVYGQAFIETDVGPNTYLEGGSMILFDEADSVVGFSFLDEKGFYQIPAKPGRYRLCLAPSNMWWAGQDYWPDGRYTRDENGEVHLIPGTENEKNPDCTDLEISDGLLRCEYVHSSMRLRLIDFECNK